MSYLNEHGLETFKGELDIDKAKSVSLAPVFSTDTAYVSGELVVKDGLLYKFTANHAAGAWTGSDVQAVQISSELNALRTYVTPQMFGATGDGVTDDYQAFSDAISSSDIIFIPEGTYQINTKITVPASKTIIGANIETTVLNAPNGVIISGRNVSISNVSLIGDDTPGSSGIELGDSYAFIDIRNCTISKYDDGILSRTFNWNCAFSNIRITLCNYAISFTGSTYSSFAITFTNIMTTQCVKNFRLNATSATFISSNFGIQSTFPSFTISNTCSLTFIGCNFENDVTGTDTSNGVFDVGAQKTVFLQCSFVFKMQAGCRYFVCSSAATSITIDSPKIVYATGNNFSLTTLFKNPPNTMKYQSIRLLNFKEFNLLTLDIYRSLYPIFQIDELPIRFYSTSINLANLMVGQMLVQTDTSIVCYYNGTNIVDFSGAIII